MKRFSISLVTREMGIKLTRYHTTLMRMALMKTKKESNKYRQGHEEMEPSYISSGNVKWCCFLRKQFFSSSKKYMELLYDPAIPLLDIYPK